MKAEIYAAKKISQLSFCTSNIVLLWQTKLMTGGLGKSDGFKSIPVEYRAHFDLLCRKKNSDLLIF